MSSGPVVLLVGDDPATSIAALHGLHAAGYEAKPVRLGQRAASIGGPKTGRVLVRDPVELVVLDASRRPHQAMRFLEFLRGTDGTLPVIIIAGADAETRDEAARLGAEAVLDTPLDISRLRAAAESLVPALREFDHEVVTRGYSFH